jgi:malate synthase
VRQIVREELDKVKVQMGDASYAKGRYEDAAQLMIDLVEQPVFNEFLTLPAYDRIIADEKAAAAA